MSTTDDAPTRYRARIRPLHSQICRVVVPAVAVSPAPTLVARRGGHAGGTIVSGATHTPAPPQESAFRSGGHATRGLCRAFRLYRARKRGWGTKGADTTRGAANVGTRTRRVRSVSRFAGLWFRRSPRDATRSNSRSNLGSPTGVGQERPRGIWGLTYTPSRLRTVRSSKPRPHMEDRRIQGVGTVIAVQRAGSVGNEQPGCRYPACRHVCGLAQLCSER